MQPEFGCFKKILRDKVMNTPKSALFAASAVCALLTALPASAQEAMPSMEDMWRIVQAQQATIEQLKAKLELNTVETVKTQAAVEETQAVVEEARQGVEAVASALETTQSGPQNLGWWNKTSLGGYGEMHYSGGAKDQLDFHRFVLFFGHEFSDKVRFSSELELEHAFSGDGAPGEVELEQAYIEADVRENTQIFVGARLVPVGLINETHEPPTFYGVERNAIENNILPTTWWEGGFGVKGNIASTGFSYDAMVSSGLELNTNNGYKVRSGRQNLAEANFKDQAYTARLAYSGIAGVKLASSLYYQKDVTQGIGDALSGKSVSALLWTANMDAKWNGFGFRALYANWSLSGDEVRASGRNSQTGYYLEPSYKFSLPVNVFEHAQFGVFYRYSNWDNNRGLKNSNTGTRRHAFGANFWPVPDVVLKMDYTLEDRQGIAQTRKSLNLGLGYQF
jgi:hypothetical protein